MPFDVISKTRVYAQACHCCISRLRYYYRRILAYTWFILCAFKGLFSIQSVLITGTLILLDIRFMMLRNANHKNISDREQTDQIHSSTFDSSNMFSDCVVDDDLNDDSNISALIFGMFIDAFVDCKIVMYIINTWRTSVVQDDYLEISIKEVLLHR